MLRLENLSFYQKEGHLLGDDQSFHIVEGQILILNGSAACGKSSLMRVLQGKLRPQNGTVTYFGKIFADCTRLECAEAFGKIGWINQEQSLLAHMSVIDNALLPLHATGKFEADSLNDALAFLKWFELDALAERMVSEISASQYQRLCFVRALISKPKLLIADEPFTHIEPLFAARILGLLQALTKQGMAGLILTQKPPDVSSSNWRVLKWEELKLKEVLA